jgi:hypothetical protein
MQILLTSVTGGKELTDIRENKESKNEKIKKVE